MARKAFLVAVIAALSTATFLPNAHTSQKIVGGEASTLGQFPYIVSLSFEGSLHCGGALISPTKVLTAGHCSDLDPKSLTVRGGTAQWNSGGKAVDVKDIVVHPEYNYDTFKHDIAIWTLSGPLAANNSTIAYAKLPMADNDPKDGDSTTVMGWGDTSERTDEATGSLRHVSVPIVDRQECDTLYVSAGYNITDDMICAGFLEGGKDSCQGDSGGPLVDDVTRELVGIVSFGEGCARPEYPGVYSRVGAAMDFITANL